MLTIGGPVYLAAPVESHERILTSGKVLECTDENFLAEFEEILSPKVGDLLEAYAEWKRKFYRQRVKVLEIRQVEPTPIIYLERVGEPESAEQRQVFRLSTVAAGINGRVGDQADCSIVDISPEGFAVKTRRELKLGSIVQANFSFEEDSILAKVIVRTFKALRDGSFRYGLLVPEFPRQPRQTLQKMSARAQRMQLKRLAGAA